MQDKVFRRSWKISHNDSFLYFILMVDMFLFNSSIAIFFLPKCLSLSVIDPSSVPTHFLHQFVFCSPPLSSSARLLPPSSPAHLLSRPNFRHPPIFFPPHTFFIHLSSVHPHFFHPLDFCSLSSFLPTWTIL